MCTECVQNADQQAACKNEFVVINVKNTKTYQKSKGFPKVCLLSNKLLSVVS